MSALDFFTWLSIAVLVIGSAAVFAWFLADARRLLRSMKRDDEEAQPKR